MIFDQETLEMLYDEVIGGDDFTAWLDSLGYSSGMTDQEIYAILPGNIKSELGEFGLNASWMHDGM